MEDLVFHGCPSRQGFTYDRSSPAPPKDNDQHVNTAPSDFDSLNYFGFRKNPGPGRDSGTATKTTARVREKRTKTRARLNTEPKPGQTEGAWTRASGKTPTSNAGSVAGVGPLY